jgi:hypothetical protein
MFGEIEGESMKTVACIVAVLACSILIGRAEDRTPKPPEELLPQTTNGNFVLYVSNQSFDMSPVDITIDIDGKKEVSDLFSVGNQHTWITHTFQLARGPHKITVVSKNGSARLEQAFEIKEKQWAAIGYWFTKQDGKKQFAFTILDKPIAFM